MIEKKCIIIDDEPQDESIENLTETLRKEGIRLDCRQLNPKDREFRKNIGTPETPEYAIDLNLVLDKLSTVDFFKKKVDIIACDYNLGDDKVNGFEVIAALRAKSYNRGIMLYSGSQDQVIRAILKVSNLPERIKKIKKLATSNISHITDRDDYKATLIGCIRDETFSIRYSLEQLLEDIGNLELKSFPKDFKGKKVNDILEEIKKDTPAGIKFQKLIIEFAVSNLVEMNSDD